MSSSSFADFNADSASLISPGVSPENLQLDKRVKLGVMASGSGSNFEAVAQAIADGKLNAEISVVVYNNPTAKVVERAKRWNIPAVLLNHRNFETREDLERAIIQTFSEYGVEWVIMAGWMRVITSVLIEAFPDRMINIHPSILPSFKGIRAIEQALAAKVKMTGCTVHIVRLEVDSGPILMQAAVPVLPDDTPETLHQRVQVQEHRILPLAIAIAVKQAQKS